MDIYTVLLLVILTFGVDELTDEEWGAMARPAAHEQSE
jgi:hypothetical protein